MLYRMVMPNDYNSEADAAALGEQFPGLEGDALMAAILRRVREAWPGIRVLKTLDFGWLISASTPPVEPFPVCVWISADK